jgi:thioredoxin 1
MPLDPNRRWLVERSRSASRENMAVLTTICATLTVQDRLHTFAAPRAPDASLRRGEARFAMAVGKVSDANFDAEVLKSIAPVVVDFWAEWCGPCRMIGPALEEIAGAMGEKVKIVKLNVDENPATTTKYGIKSIPTLMIFKGGQLAAQQVGAASKPKLEQWITTTV